eukprot:608430-Pelagomonas_calceolata.AAC.4
MCGLGYAVHCAKRRKEAWLRGCDLRTWLKQKGSACLEWGLWLNRGPKMPACMKLTSEQNTPCSDAALIKFSQASELMLHANNTKRPGCVRLAGVECRACDAEPGVLWGNCKNVSDTEEVDMAPEQGL